MSVPLGAERGPRCQSVRTAGTDVRKRDGSAHVAAGSTLPASRAPDGGQIVVKTELPAPSFCGGFYFPGSETSACGVAALRSRRKFYYPVFPGFAQSAFI